MSDPYFKAFQALDAADLPAALDLLIQIGRTPDSLAYDEAWAEVELRRGEYSQAAQTAQRLLKTGRVTQRLHRVLAEAQWMLGLREEARESLAQAEDDARTAYIGSRIANSYGEYEEAERLAERASALWPAPWIAAEAMALAARASQGDRDARVALRLLWERTRNDDAL